MKQTGLKCKQFGIYITLALLTVSAFGIRFQNFLNSHTRTIDEVVYFYLGKQLTGDITKYHSLEYAVWLEQSQPELLPLPEYFYQPLFKHPPLFPLMIALSFKVFGPTMPAAVSVTVLFGVLMIPLIYWLGRTVFNKGVGLISAFVLWLDPVSIICSQKIWMDTTLSFFMLLSLCLFAVGVKEDRHHFFIYSGISAGLAMLTKYPGGLSVGIILIYGFAFRQDLLRLNKFWLGILVAFSLNLPWGLWNLFVYGITGFWQHLQLHEMLQRGFYSMLILGFAGVMMISLGYGLTRLMLRKISGHEADNPQEIIDDDDPPSAWRSWTVSILGVILALALRKSIASSLFWKHFPMTTWQGGQFQDSLFYFGRLIEFNILYLFSFLSFFIVNERIKNQAAVLYLGSLIVLIFFIMWGNYQSRYILPALPMLIILAVGFIQHLWIRCRQSDRKWVRIGVQWVLTLTAVYAFLKVNYINYLVSYPNNMCYF